MKHRVGFIGFGDMGGGYHFQVARDRKDVCDDLAPVAVCDLRPERRAFAEENGLKTYENVDEFLKNDEFDIVVVATPNNLHCEMTCKALEAGKHVICEKPVAMSLDEFEKMVETSKRTGKYFFVHQNRRFDCDFLIAKQAYDTGRIGRMKHIDATFSGGYMSGWRTLKSHGGGILYDWGVHLIDQIVYLMGEDRPVSVYAELNSDFLTEVDDYAAVNINFASGVTARVLVSGDALVPTYRWSFRGDLGQMWVDSGYQITGTLRSGSKLFEEHIEVDAYNSTEHYTVDTVKIKKEGLGRITYPDDGFSIKQDWAELYKHMLDTIDNDAPMFVKYDQVRDVLKVIDAAHKSSETKTVIKL